MPRKLPQPITWLTQAEPQHRHMIKREYNIYSWTCSEMEFLTLISYKYDAIYKMEEYGQND